MLSMLGLLLLLMAVAVAGVLVGSILEDKAVEYWEKYTKNQKYTKTEEGNHVQNR